MTAIKIGEVWFARITVRGKTLYGDGSTYMEATSKVIALLGDTHGNN